MNSRRIIYLGWLAMLTAVGLIITSAILPSGPNQILRILGVASVLFAPVLFVPPFFFLARQRDRAEERTYMETTAVVQQGPYRLVRHPQYLGYMLLSIGFGLIKQQWLVTFLGIMAVALFVLLAVAEEAELHRRFGESFAEYCQQVPRFNLLLGFSRYLRSKTT